MGDDLTAVEDWVAAIMHSLEPGQRRTLATRLARDLRNAQAARIEAQQDPDGNAFAQRRPQKALRGKKGTIKRGPMFRKLRLAKRLKVIEATGNEIGVGFTGRNARIAQTHQDGANERARSKSGREFVIGYPQRRLLGLTDADKAQLLDAVLAFIA